MKQGIATLNLRKIVGPLLGLTLCLLLAGAFVASAQVTTATIYGIVLEPTGAAVPNATVTAIQEQTSLTKTATTNVRGEFSMSFLPVGSYTIKVEANGFKTYTETGLALSAGQKVNLTYQLELGTTTETVTVTTEAPLMNTVSAQQDVRLNTLQVSELPLARRDITNILNLGTGVSAGGSTISLNGLPPRGFTFTVDGVDASPDEEFASLSLYQNFNYIKGVSVEAVKEVEVAKNIFSAEIAQTVSGNVNLITKSGTNAFHGSVFEYYQAGGLNAVNHFTSRKSSEVYHQFGGSLGGPIVPDKLFFFSTYEGYRKTAKSPVSGDVPSNWARQQITAAIPEAQTYFDLWPLPTGPEQPGDWVASYAGSGVEDRHEDQGNIRVDYNISDNNHLIARYTRGHPNYLRPRLAFGNSRTYVGMNENIAATFTRVWSPTLTSETRFGINRSKVDRSDGIYTAHVPSIEVAGSPGAGGETFVKWGSTSTVEHNFFLVKGRHSIKFGGLYRWHLARRLNEEVPQYEYETLQDAIENRPTGSKFQFMLKPFEVRRWYTGVFLQDDIRVNPDLMVNLGIRYDYGDVPNERDDRLFNRDGPYGPYRDPDSAWNAYYGMVSPRAGFAWTVGSDKKTVIRGGFGIFFIPFNLFSGPVEIVMNSPNEPVEARLSTNQLAQLGIHYPMWNSDVKPMIQKTGLTSDTAIDPNWENSYSLQWTLGIQRELTKTLVWDIAYVGNHGVKLIYSPYWNRVDRVTGLRENENFGQFRYYQSADSSIYDSLQTSLKKRFSKNLQFNVNYTYASNTSYFRGDYNCCGTSENPQDLNRLDLNHGPTSYHIRHRFISDFLYDVPIPYPADNAAAKGILGGWQLSGIFEAQTGQPLLITQSTSASPGGRPDFVGKSFDDAVLPNWDQPRADGTYQYLNQAAFAQVPVSPVSKAMIRPGTLGRRSIYGPGMWNLDMAIAKNIDFGEGKRLQFRADFFNFLNHTVLSSVETNIRKGSAFGRIKGARPGRVTQLSLRFEF